jgi:hypothetical protein
LLELVSTHTDPHRDVPPGHTHVPIEHVVPPVQLVPHAPQFALLLCVSMHMPPHDVVPVGHPQTPAAQTAPLVHACPHIPQFALLS